MHMSSPVVHMAILRPPVRGRIREEYAILTALAKLNNYLHNAYNIWLPASAIERCLSHCTGNATAGFTHAAIAQKELN